jgi:hypothetical protein
MGIATVPVAAIGVPPMAPATRNVRQKVRYRLARSGRRDARDPRTLLNRLGNRLDEREHPEPLYARSDQVVQSFCGVGSASGGGARSFSARHISVSPLRRTSMTEKWMTENAPRTSAARAAAFMPLQHSLAEELTQPGGFFGR